MLERWVIVYFLFSDVYVGYWSFSEVAVKVSRTKQQSHTNLVMDLVTLDGSAARWNVRHPNIMLVYGATVLTDGRFAVVSELLESSLSELISGLNETLNLRERTDLAVGVACGLRHLHRMGFVHGSVRPDHVLITYSMTAKLTLPRIHGLFDVDGSGDDSRSFRIRYGKYIAPERLSRIGAIVKKPTFQSDVYGLVMTVSELIRFHLTGTPTDLEQSPLLLGLDYDPKQRCSVADVVKYLSSFRQTEEYGTCPPKREVKGKYRNSVTV